MKTLITVYMVAFLLLSALCMALLKENTELQRQVKEVTELSMDQESYRYTHCKE